MVTSPPPSTSTRPAPGGPRKPGPPAQGQRTSGTPVELSDRLPSGTRGMLDFTDERVLRVFTSRRIKEQHDGLHVAPD